MVTKPKLEFRLLTDKDASKFKEIRLEALQEHPEAFLGSHAVESKKPKQFFLDAVNHDKVMGCFKKETGRLLGIVGYYVITPEKHGKRAHSAKIWGFYIRHEYRGRGFAKKLFSKLLDEAEGNIEKVLLKVNARSRGAIKLYQSLGFSKYGFEARSLKIGDKYYDDVLMVKFLDDSDINPGVRLFDH